MPIAIIAICSGDISISMFVFLIITASGIVVVSPYSTMGIPVVFGVALVVIENWIPIFGRRRRVNRIFNRVVVSIWVSVIVPQSLKILTSETPDKPSQRNGLSRTSISITFGNLVYSASGMDTENVDLISTRLTLSSTCSPSSNLYILSLPRHKMADSSVWMQTADVIDTNAITNQISMTYLVCTNN